MRSHGLHDIRLALSLGAGSEMGNFQGIISPIMVPTILFLPHPKLSLQMTSPEKPPRIILPSFRKMKTGKTPARRAQNSTLTGGLHLGESDFWKVCVCRGPCEWQTLYLWK